MRIEVQDLRIGDEVIVSRFSDLRYLKVLGNPKPKKQQHQYRQIIQYSAIKCSTGVIPRTVQTTWNPNSPCATPEHHTEIIYVDFNYKDIWLVKREVEDVI